jgi:hypothetical protein
VIRRIAREALEEDGRGETLPFGDLRVFKRARFEITICDIKVWVSTGSADLPERSTASSGRGSVKLTLAFSVPEGIGFLFIGERPQVPAKTRRGPALRRTCRGSRADEE